MDYGTQPRAPIELRVISWPPDSEWGERYPNYVYITNPHKQVYIYHAELGINEIHQDFDRRRIEWLITENARQQGRGDRKESDDDGGYGHSTCTASKAIGSGYGASKHAILVVVKMAHLDHASVGDVFSIIARDIHDKGRQGRSVVSVSWGSVMTVDEIFNSPQQDFFWQSIEQQLGWLNQLDTLCIVAAGNNAQKGSRDYPYRPRSSIDTLPASYMGTNFPRRYNSVLAASNCDVGGGPFVSSQYYFGDERLKIYNPIAPGVNVKCATSGGRTGEQIQTGTSFCKLIKCLQA